MLRSRPARRVRRRRGFTLMEVLLVLAILIILAGGAMVAINQTYNNARRNSARLNIDTIEQGINAYYLSVGQYPPTLQALVAPPDGLVNPDKWQGPYLDKGELPADPWGNEYQYIVDLQTEQFEVYSLGKDGVADSGDEVR